MSRHQLTRLMMIRLPCKVKVAYLPDGTKVRVSKRTGTVIPKPAELKTKKFKNYIGTSPCGLVLASSLSRDSLVAFLRSQMGPRTRRPRWPC